MYPTFPFYRKSSQSIGQIQSGLDERQRDYWDCRLSRSGLFAFFQFGSGVLALEVTLAAFAFERFIILLSHNSLLCSLDAVLS
jgi:hypothetical protein